MNGCDWILCERSQRWAAALRYALGRQTSQPRPRRIYETRNLSDMLARLNSRPESLVLIEVNQANFATVLDCLADAAPRFASARFAVLLEGTLASPHDRRSKTHRHVHEDALDALAEAGACEFAASPRKLRGIFDLARRHANHLTSRFTPPDDRPLEVWAMSLLPWQDE